MTKTLPIIASKTPFPIEVKAGQRYSWCSCGASKTQPFCDGAHKAFQNSDGTSVMKSVKYDANEDKIVLFCGCKQSKTGAICDNSHKNLTQN